ncbi:hypothetical protein LTR10_018326 [Elasticomyces elasticus]|uniref:Zn(2)-C6 fungal-type domain-containing protein n=1 Tax=Exophiala sideris TaxID=1016849 RepID=A0ABR0JM95_9EURO|nr:hypothetical protein LTR10_018326 [Elasticomyces elasticus]KAK5036716.1 hypothetical protein LTS07_002444 [Exophiala sideris]KAK5067100.1 hypothetical protein LTR69_002449 [Exophiala sideris]
MDDIGDVDIKHERSNPYPPAPPSSVHRMPPAETPTLHNYPPPHAAGMPPPAPAWNPAPSPYSEPSDHRPPPPDLGHQQSYPPPPHSYPHPPPPGGRETPGYPPDSYARPSSVSGPSRSPGDIQHPPYQPVSTPHESSYYPQPPPDYRPRHAYSGPESQPNGTLHPPLHVVTGHEMMSSQPPGYGPPSAGPPPSAGGYSAGPYYAADPYLQAQRRKPVRAAQACDSCRQRKAKCDEGRPECQHCKDNGLKCSYREVPPQKSEKQMITITDKLEALTASVHTLIQSQEAQGEQIKMLLSSTQVARPAGPDTVDAYPSDEAAVQAVRTTRTTAHKQPESYPLQREDSSEARIASRVSKQRTNSSKDNSDETGYNLTLPPDHTTAVQNLFNWPSIRDLIPKGITPSYVMDEETGRGLLRLYGCGEGEDKHDGHEGVPSPAGSTSSEGRRMDEEASSSPHGVWGSGQFHAPVTSTQSHTARDHPGGVSPHGGLMLDSEAVDRYFRSFMEHLHILHPFLEPKVLRTMIHTFKRKYSWDYRATQPATTIGTKRKRDTLDSPNSVDDQNTGTHGGHRGQARGYPAAVPPIEHSVANAIVLLVMALGKVTSHRDPLPGPAMTTTMRTSTPHSALYSDLPMPMSAPPSPFNNQVSLNGATNTIAVSSPANPQGKNMDNTPGLAYFAKAADILGELPGGTDVSHIQANLLAGLYMGQLARILPSYTYITNACMAAQILIQSTEYKERTMKPARRNLINFAFWSCLQLESDIAAELELPLSGITRFEGEQHKEFPTKVTLEQIPEENKDNNILRFYSYQIQLRVEMNSIHSTLYRRSKNHNGRPTVPLMQALDENLQDWRRLLGDWDWSENDHEDPNINVARLRGKYYGAKYIIWRPAVHYALLVASAQKERPIESRPSESPAGYEMTSDAKSPFWWSNTSNEDDSTEVLPGITKEILTGVRKCINAAIRSTTVFDKVPRRLITTNIFGTAHAQFGNMLVLYATYKSPHPALSSLVDEHTLKRLHDRTVRILRENELISPVLAKDLKILEHVRLRAFGPPTSYPAVSSSSSFSSNR